MFGLWVDSTGHFVKPVKYDETTNEYVVNTTEKRIKIDDLRRSTEQDYKFYNHSDKSLNLDFVRSIKRPLQGVRGIVKDFKPNTLIKSFNPLQPAAVPATTTKTVLTPTRNDSTLIELSQTADLSALLSLHDDGPFDT